MLRYYLILIAVLGAGILIGHTLVTDPAAEQPVPPAGHSPAGPAAPLSPFRPGEPETLAVLQQQLQQAREAREQLVAQLETLQLRVEELETGFTGTAAASGEAEAPEPDTGQPPVPKTSVQSLIDTGIDPEQAAWIQGRLDEIDLQQLYLRDRATREGWLNQPRYHKERREFANAVTGLRQDIGDEAYDRMLYTLGRPNRVVVRDIMLNSPAEQYGLQAGDRVIEYDGQRVFATGELTALTGKGNDGAMILVRVQRNGEYHDLYVPRGPLGIRMSSMRELP